MNVTMHEITLRGAAYQRGLQQGRAYGHLLRELQEKCPTWLGGKPTEEVNRIRDTMIRGLNSLWPEMVEELRGISDGSGMPFEEVCTVNFVSAIGALRGCTNLVALKAEDGPTLAKTSDIGDDHIYYSVQRVEPEHGHAFLSVGWAGCLWAEVGINSAGLAVGQGSGPIQHGQSGEGIPTLEYPRMILAVLFHN